MYVAPSLKLLDINCYVFGIVVVFVGCFVYLVAFLFLRDPIIAITNTLNLYVISERCETYSTFETHSNTHTRTHTPVCGATYHHVVGEEP